MRNKHIAPSILSANFAALGNDVSQAVQAGAEYLHIDVMDGRFVPNISMGIPVVKALRAITDCTLDVHLMIEQPAEHIRAFIAAGADMISVHVEACPHLHRTICLIKEAGVQAGVALNPASPLSLIEEVLGMVDLVVLMSVNPGFGGQTYIEQSTQKIRRLRQLLKTHNSLAMLEVDGGVHTGNIRSVADAGADILVAGSAVFNVKGSIADNLAALRQAIAP